MHTVIYTDSNTGYKYAALVPSGTAEAFEEYPFFSPPDLSSLGLTETMCKKLHNALVDAGLFVAPQLMGKRAILRQILTDLGLPRTLGRVILSLFQHEFYGDT